MLPFWQAVRGDSMLPALRDGDEVLLASPVEVTVGDVVVVRVPSRPGTILHRVVHREGARVVTRGDACLRNDPVLPRANVLFKALARRRQGTEAPIPAALGRNGRRWWRWGRRLASALAAPGRWWRGRPWCSTSTGSGSSA